MNVHKRHLLGAAAAAGFIFTLSPAEAEQDQGVETVVVTGTRIPRPETDTANPVVSLSAEDIQRSGTVNLADYLKRIPALTGSLGDFDNSGYNTHSSSDGSSLDGLNLLDLRNLGYVRTLVLQDGHRIVSDTTGSAGVDIESIPITLIDRVEVVTGGSSAVYGADGVSGVVNFVMKHNLDGVTARAQYGDSQDGGGAKWLAAASVGRNFDDDKGNITFTLEMSHQDNLEFQQRSFTSVGGYYSLINNPANRNGRNPDLPANIFTNDGQFIYSAPTGAITTNLNSAVPNYLGNGQKYIRGIAFLDGGVAIGSSGMPFADDLQGDFQPVQNREIAQIEGNEEFNKWFKLSAEFKYAHVGTQDISTAPYDDTIMISSHNAFLPSNVASAIAGNGLGYGILSEDYLAMRNGENVDRDTYRGVLDATGALPGPAFIQNFKYDVSYVYGQTDIADTIIDNRNIDRFSAALDSVIGPDGQPVCRSNLDPSAIPPTLKLIYGKGPGNNTFSDQSTWGPKQFGSTFTPGPNSGCVPFNPFDPNYNNKASIAWMTSNTTTAGFISQQVFSGFISGDIPAAQDLGLAKPISLVIGGEYRQEVSKSSPDPLTEVPGLFWYGGTQPVRGTYNVSEEFGEASIPVVADEPFVKELTFDVAGRLSDYSTAGSSQSWKIDGLYSPISGIKFRATTALAVRAPNIGELYAPSQLEFTFINDPCDLHNVFAGTAYRVTNCKLIENALLGPGKYIPGKTGTETDSTTPEYVGGNQGLTPETARTQTLGIVLQPDFLPDFVATVDWYRVNIRNAIEAPEGQDVANECVDLSTINNPFCGEITRTATGLFPGSIKQVVAKEINVAAYFTQGEDFSATYHADLDTWFDTHLGSLDFHLIGNHLDSLSETPLPGEKPVQWANVVFGGLDGTPVPYWQLNLDTVWTFDKWTVDYDVDWYDGLLIVNRQTYYSEPNYVAKKYFHLNPRDVHSLQVGYDFLEGYNVYVGVDNLWYQKPTIGQSGYPVDPLGRFFYGGVKIDLNP